MKRMNLLLFCMFLIGVEAGTPIQQAPAAVGSWQNPYGDSPDAILAGQKLFKQHCAACHGENARGIQRIPALISPTVKDASPGALFWVLRNGSLRHGMPSFSNLPEQRRWQIVTYLKSLRI